MKNVWDINENKREWKKIKEEGSDKEIKEREDNVMRGEGEKGEEGEERHYRTKVI